MNRTSFALLLCCSFFLVSSLIAHTVVLKNGKKIVGILVSETEETLSLKDEEGITINVKKSTVDIEKTAAANPEDTKVSREAVPVPEPPTKEQKAKKTTRTLTNEDLKDMPELSKFEEQKPDEQHSEAPTAKGTSTSQEFFWRKEFTRRQDKIRETKHLFVIAERECFRSGGHDSWETTVGGERIKNRSCLRVDDLQKEIKFLEDELFEFQQRARRDGVPPEWIQ